MTLLSFIPISPNTNSTTSFLANDPYIDTFWLPLLGPTSTLLLHHLMTKALCETQQFEIQAGELSTQIGVGNRDIKKKKLKYKRNKKKIQKNK